MKKISRIILEHISIIIILIIVLFVLVLIRRGIIPLSSSEEDVRFFGVVSNIATILVVAIGGFLSYIKFFKGRILHPKVIISITSGKTIKNNEIIYYLEAQCDNKGTTTIWDYTIDFHIYTFINGQEKRIDIPYTVPPPPRARGNRKIIDVGESVYAHALAVLPTTVDIAVFQVTLADKTGNIWWRSHVNA